MAQCSEDTSHQRSQHEIQECIIAENSSCLAVKWPGLKLMGKRRTLWACTASLGDCGSASLSWT